MINLKDQSINLPVLHEKFNHLYTASKNIWQIADNFLPDRIGIGKCHQLNLCITAIYSKQMKLYFSTFQLCYHGLGSEALLPLRTMFEIYLNLKFLGYRKKPWAIAHQWLLWGYANDERQIKLLRSTNTRARQIKKLLKNGLKKERNLLSDKDWKNFVR